MNETAFGGTSLCKQHHIVARVCPYCEIDRLKEELTELAKEISILRKGLEQIAEPCDYKWYREEDAEGVVIDFQNSTNNGWEGE